MIVDVAILLPKDMLGKLPKLGKENDLFWPFAKRPGVISQNCSLI